jgi:hypothetical protein
VLVAKSREILPDAGKGKAPFDAQLWLSLAPRR